MNKFRYWLLKHGLEFEGGECGNAVGGQLVCIDQSPTIVINHRFFGFDFIFVFEPFKGTFEHELHKPHAQIAAERIAPLPVKTLTEHEAHILEDAKLIAEVHAPVRKAIDLMLTVAVEDNVRPLSASSRVALEKFDAEHAEVHAELVKMIADFEQQEQAGQQ